MQAIPVIDDRILQHGDMPSLITRPQLAHVIFRQGGLVLAGLAQYGSPRERLAAECCFWPKQNLQVPAKRKLA
jgi:hypothetical protein